MNGQPPPAPPKAPRPWHFEWLWPVLRHPTQALRTIRQQAKPIWLTPLLILSVLAVLQVLVAGPIQRQALIEAGPSLPPDFQYYTPEDQARFLQAAEAAQGPAFLYAFPGGVALAQVWLGWLIVGSALHLVLTVLGGRSTVGEALNLAAWSGLPYGVRSLVRAAGMLATRRLISSPGLSGLLAAQAGTGSLFLSHLLGVVDLYLVWQAALLILGVRSENDPGRRTAWAAVLVTLAIAVLLQVLPGFLADRLGSLTIVRPFFF
jgi:hypothetical protein